MILTQAAPTGIFDGIAEGLNYRVTGAGTWDGGSLVLSAWNHQLADWSTLGTLTEAAPSLTVIATGQRLRAVLTGSGAGGNLAAEALRLPFAGLGGATSAASMAAATTGSTAKTILVDADEIAITDSAASFGPKKATVLSIWNAIKAKLDLGQAWSGLHSFISARPTCSAGGVPAATSLVTRDDVDARALVTIFGYATATQDATNTVSFVASTQGAAITIPSPGLYLIEYSAPMGSSAWATAGCKCKLMTTGTVSATVSGNVSSGGRAGATLINTTMVHNAGSATYQPIHGGCQHPSQSQWFIHSGLIRYTTAGTAAIGFAQYVAIEWHYVRLDVGAYIKAIRISD